MTPSGHLLINEIGTSWGLTHLDVRACEAVTTYQVTSAVERRTQMTELGERVGPKLRESRLLTHSGRCGNFTQLRALRVRSDADN